MTVDPDMQLPPGKTCFDCRHYTRCTWLISTAPSRTSCDWAPSRFYESNEADKTARFEHIELKLDGSDA